jgi:hypothetical protein
MGEHRCDVPHCDGTRLGHDLAVEFPEETARIDDAFDRLRDQIAVIKTCTCVGGPHGGHTCEECR